MVPPAAPSLPHALTALCFAPFWLRGLGFLIHHRSQRLQGREQSAGRELWVAPGRRLRGQDPRASGATAQPRTHVFLVFLPFLALLVGHNDACPEGLEHGVAPVGCCRGTDAVRGVRPWDVRRGGSPGAGTLLTEQLLDAGVLLVTVQGRAVRPAKPWGLGVVGRSEHRHHPDPWGLGGGRGAWGQLRVLGNPSEPGGQGGDGARATAAGTRPLAPRCGAWVFPAGRRREPRAGGSTHDFTEAALHLHVGLAVVVDVRFAVLAPQAELVVDWPWGGRRGGKERQRDTAAVRTAGLGPSPALAPSPRPARGPQPEHPRDSRTIMRAQTSQNLGFLK